ncbi:hypothetical protein [Psychroserpens sp.]|nr:hypothetical protein [Psychroserpens sp.]MBO6630748.1 hypothetical protein [Psychroserpens sp.]MBO6652507.1 hypothetical protein [Psychroserpens sp.]MBO6681721.1 hypothetical protein [Psychroserpens sp.]MBO6749496.1 hypothetical protein [Psychroserpens sp.]MBO6941219.1 hypothetical protein [Psychroserpens sp.]
MITLHSFAKASEHKGLKSMIQPNNTLVKCVKDGGIVGAPQGERLPRA